MAKYILDQVAESAAGLFIPDNPEDQIGHGNEHIVGAAQRTDIYTDIVNSDLSAYGLTKEG